MSDYRDDRPALRQRIEALEAELSRSQDRVAELEERLRAPPVESKPKLGAFRKPPLPAIAIVGLVAVAMAAIIALTTSQSRVAAPIAAQPRQAPVPTPAKPPEPPPRTASVSCRCETEVKGSVVLMYRANGSMSMGGNSTYFLDAGLRVSGPSGERNVELAPNRDTAPPSALEGGNDRLLLACLQDRIVLALGHRATAWAFEDGRQLWTATLPAPVGQQKNGPLSIECDPLEVKDGVIEVPHPGGTTKLDPKVGSPALRDAN